LLPSHVSGVLSMAGHSQNVNDEPDDPGSRAHNARLGLWLFFIYLAAYVAYVAISSVRASWLDLVVFAGLNLATVFGMVLIVGAFVLAIVYTLFCTTPKNHGGSA
jgi:uncharacterized membrane protein (DUF485 family)